MNSIKKAIAMLCIGILAISILPLASGEGFEKPSLAVNDKWIVKHTSVKDYTLVLTMTMELTKEDTISVGTNTYNVFEGKFSADVVSWDLEGYVSGSDDVSGTFWLEKSFQRMVKLVMDFSFKIKDEDGVTHDAKTRMVTMKEYTGQEPKTINIGATWSITEKTKEERTMTLDGTEYDPVVSETTKNYNYGCKGKKEVTVQAGTFDTFEIKAEEVGSSNYTLYYYSTKAKTEVKMLSYSGANLIDQTELISYTVKDTTPKKTEDKKGFLPFFELSLLIGLLIILAIAIRRKMKTQ